METNCRRSFRDKQLEKQICCRLVEQAFPNSFHSNVPNFGGYIPLLGNQKKKTLSKTVLVSFPLIFSLPNIKSSAKNKHYYDRYSRKSRAEKKKHINGNNKHSQLYTSNLFFSNLIPFRGTRQPFVFVSLPSLAAYIHRTIRTFSLADHVILRQRKPTFDSLILNKKSSIYH